MSPKFKGGSDDWLDSDEESSNASRTTGPRAAQSRKSARQGRAKILSPDEANAVVAEVFMGQCLVRMDGGGPDILCSYRRANVIKSDPEIRERSPVAVGDRVKVERIGLKSGIVDGVCERRNHLSRPAPGRENVRFQHVIAANIDDLVMVASAREPEFSSGLIDRFLVSAMFAGITPILCLSKVDLLGTGESRPSDLHRQLGYQVFEISSKSGIGIDGLRKRIEGRAVVFCGQSGVGKTSLLRRLLGTEIGRVAEISGSTGKGKHTTTGAVLLQGTDPSGSNSQWIDTPGVREFGLGEIPPSRLAECFPEFATIRCGQASCMHLDEPGCGARLLARYSSYRRILESLLAGKN